MSTAETKKLFSRRVREAVAEQGALRVIPIRTGKDWCEGAPEVGRARTANAALRLVREAGYRVMWVGGELCVSGAIDGIDREVICITVHP